MKALVPFNDRFSDSIHLQQLHIPVYEGITTFFWQEIHGNTTSHPELQTAYSTHIDYFLLMFCRSIRDRLLGKFWLHVCINGEEQLCPGVSWS